MKKILDKNLSLFFTPNYPKEFSHSNKTNHVVIGIGGNIGDVKKSFNKLLLQLLKDARFDIVKTSPLLKNPPFGYLEQNDFLNGVIFLKTNLSAHESLKAFQRLENRFKRKRFIKDGPRTLDIDIIFYNDFKINSKNLIVPHPHWFKRESVTIPLKYVMEKTFETRL